MIKRSVAAAAAGRFTSDSAFVGGVAALFGYSTLAAFTAFEGAVHYDFVAYAVVVVTLWNHFGVGETTPDTASIEEPAADAGGAAADAADEEPVAMTDGGR
jgi:polyisoprenoid-binding protein YceI